MSWPARATDVPNNPRPLTSQETEIFLELTCAHPVLKDGAYDCSKILGRSDKDDWTDDQHLALTSIAYGNFTANNSDQAYVSYTAFFEGHATNMGGGILFERSNGPWKLIRWYSGQQTDECVTFSTPERQKLFCLRGWIGQGELDSSLWVFRIPDSNDDAALGDALTAVLKAQDDRQTMYPAYTCKSRKSPQQAVLLSIDSLKPSQDKRYFAEASITYATAADATKACTAKHFEKVKETKDTLYFILQENSVKAVSLPASFMPVDY
jgi:hypothetical protein